MPKNNHQSGDFGAQTVPDLTLERALAPGRVCGVDEVGRGPWAGPVVAGAVVLNPVRVPDGLNDSKKLSASRRADLARELHDCAMCGIGLADVAEIDQHNILNATYLAMRRAIDALGVAPDHALIDGNRVPDSLPCAATPVIRGDGRSASIAAASIIAKVARDEIMVALAQQFPGYGWETNAGYGVKAHSEALKTLGVTPHHRRSFKPIHNMLCLGK